MNMAKYQPNLVERAGQWLRFMIERPSVLYEAEDEAAWGRCSLCAWESQERIERCALCGWPINLRGEPLQRELSKLIRRALLRDTRLVARLKAEVPWLPDDVVCGRFTGPLAWLDPIWRRAGKPPGRPYDPTRHWGIVAAMEMLMQTHAPSPAEEGEPLFDGDIQETRPARAGELKLVPCGYGLTLREAVGVLSGKQFPPGSVPSRRDGMARPALTGDLLNSIGKALQTQLGYRVGREEVFRLWRWGRQLRGSAQARWSGTRVRARRTARKMPGGSPQPPAGDQIG
jgi:hypothetical protein